MEKNSPVVTAASLHFGVSKGAPLSTIIEAQASHHISGAQGNSGIPGPIATEGNPSWA